MTLDYSPDWLSPSRDAKSVGLRPGRTHDALRSTTSISKIPSTSSHSSALLSSKEQHNHTLRQHTGAHHLPPRVHTYARSPWTNYPSSTSFRIPQRSSHLSMSSLDTRPIVLKRLSSHCIMFSRLLFRDNWIMYRRKLMTRRIKSNKGRMTSSSSRLPWEKRCPLRRHNHLLCLLLLDIPDQHRTPERHPQTRNNPQR